MDKVFALARNFFPQKQNSKEAQITLGMSTYLIAIMASLHITFGMLSVSYQYVGDPLQCYGKQNSIFEEICNSKFKYFEVGAHNLKNDNKEMKIAYYKLTNWIFMLTGKKTITYNKY